MTDRALQRLIFAGCRELGIDADTRHDLQLVATGKASMADMTDADLRKVVDALKARGFDAAAGGAKKRKARPAAKRPDVRYAHVLWRLLADAGKVNVAGPKGLNAFIRERFANAWGSVPIDIDQMADWEQIRDVNEALKAMCRRAGVEYRR
jgi:phage gp16-like protein